MARRGLFTKKQQSGKMDQQKAPSSQPVPEIFNIYRDLNETPMWVWEQCQVFGNLSALIRTDKPQPAGQPDDDILQDVWVELRMAYADQMGSAEIEAYKKSLKALKRMNDEIFMLHSLVGNGIKDDLHETGALQYAYSPELAAHLFELLNYKVNLNPNDPKSYHAALLSCRRRIGMIIIRRDLEQIKIDGMQGRMESNASKSDFKPTIAYYTAMYVSLSDMAHFHITSDISVGEYIVRVKRLVSFTDSQKKK